jgi:hypothetical protein
VAFFLLTHDRQLKLHLDEQIMATESGDNKLIGSFRKLIRRQRGSFGGGSGASAL